MNDFRVNTTVDAPRTLLSIRDGAPDSLATYEAAQLAFDVLEAAVRNLDAALKARGKQAYVNVEVTDRR